MVPKVHLYTIDPIWTPLWGYMRGQISKKWRNCMFSGSLEWNHIGWKSCWNLSIYICQIQFFPKFPYCWENWVHMRSKNNLWCVAPKFHSKVFQKSKNKNFLEEKLVKSSQFSQLQRNLGKIWIWDMKMFEIVKLFHPIWFHSSEPEPEDILFCHFFELWYLM